MSLRDKIAHQLMGLVWLVVLMGFWLLVLVIAAEYPDIRGEAITGGSILTAGALLVIQNVWRKKPPVEPPV